MSAVVLTSFVSFNIVRADELSNKLTEITIKQSKLEYKASDIEEKLKTLEESSSDINVPVNMRGIVKQSETYKSLEMELQATKADIIHVQSIRNNIEKEVKEAEEKAKKEAEEKARKEAEAKAEKERILSIAVDTDAGETNMMAETGYIKVGTDAYQVHPTSGSYPIGQCTWGAKALAPWVGDYWGDAGNWLYSAQQNGFEISTTPKVGSLAVWTSGIWGHVAYVVGVDGDNIQVLESNYGGSGYVADSRGIGNYRGWFNPVEAGIAGYVYPKE